jgi:hypothetical protein
MKDGSLDPPLSHHLKGPTMRKSAVNNDRLVRLESDIQQFPKDLPLQLLLDFDFIIQSNLP